MEATTSFDERVDQVDARLRERLPTLAVQISCERSAGSVTWRYDHTWGTLAYHETDTPPRLSLMLYTRKGSDEQNAVEVAIDDEDVVDVLVEPLAGLFTGQVT